MHLCEEKISGEIQEDKDNILVLTITILNYIIFYIIRDYLGKPQKKYFFSGPATKKRGRGGGKGLAIKKKNFFSKLQKKNFPKKIVAT